MPGFGNFAKNEKKKSKNRNKKVNTSVSSAPVFVMPKLVQKKKKED